MTCALLGCTAPVHSFWRPSASKHLLHRVPEESHPQISAISGTVTLQFTLMCSGLAGNQH